MNTCIWLPPRNNSKLWPLVFFSKQGGKGVFRDAWWDPNYQRDAWSGPNEPREAWFGLAAWCVSYYFHNAWHAIFLWNFRAGEYHLKQEAETLKIDGYDTSFLPFFLLSRPLISSDQMMIYTCLSRMTPIFFLSHHASRKNKKYILTTLCCFFRDAW